MTEQDYSQHNARLKAADEVVQSTLKRLPIALREAATSIPYTLQSLPEAELIEIPEDHHLLGLFVGEPYHSTGESPHPVPAQIFLFIDNLWHHTEGSISRFREEVRRTFLHELGHYLGLDEEDLAQRDLD